MSEIDRLLYLSTRLIIPLLPTYRKALFTINKSYRMKKPLKNIFKKKPNTPSPEKSHKTYINQKKKNSTKQKKGKKKEKYKKNKALNTINKIQTCLRYQFLYTII